MNFAVEPRPGIENLISLDRVTKEFEDGSKFLKNQRVTRAVNNVTLEIKQGEVIGLVGESGCGKSTLGRVILRLHEPTSGTIKFADQDITHIKESKLRLIRRDFQMIFQDPYASLNPRYTVKEILSKPYKIHGITFSDDLIKENMELVGLNPNFINRYPNEFSGGQRQRIGIGRAIALHPKFIVCDEPVSALDVSVQAQILNLLIDLKDKLKMTYLFISHDLSVVHHICDRIAVMYLGNIVEIQERDMFFFQPGHPYSQALLSSIPLANPFLQRKRERVILKGELPSPINPPTGCPFHPRCPVAQEKCKEVKPELRPMEAGRYVACHFPLE
ncbi:ABC transporter ATP-binding protein (plasmid) [Cytobacillus oceanisediminis]|uniref:ABC transporter ATP-binding protein n=1 Tax=Cytobacillus oceanisediminis TaxID=665099 RepID=UPI0018640665|nr:ABC transporter ATP-binding protein [Cytobacillus oceanisediminis]QOK29894.1 ABC transporter ATP-binding protein [Cytobacillus oceanisediminis]